MKGTLVGSIWDLIKSKLNLVLVALERQSQVDLLRPAWSTIASSTELHSKALSQEKERKTH